MSKKDVFNEYGECTREQMLAYLTKVQSLQRKASGKMTMCVHTLDDSGSIFGGVVREAQINIFVSVMDVFDNRYEGSWSLYQFSSVNENNAKFLDLKNKVEQFVKDFDKEWKRRHTAFVNRHGSL